MFADRIPRAPGALSLADIINAYLADVDQRCGAGELSPLSFRDYGWTCEQMVTHFGRTVDPEQLRPTDFPAFRHKLAAKCSPGRLAKTVTVMRIIIRWAFESELIVKLPRFGPGFKSTSKRAARVAKAEQGGRLFTAEEIREMLKVARPAMKAMILLGINGELGNRDVGRLPLSAVDLESGWIINFPRSKTGVARRIPLWKETVDAIGESLKLRPQPSSPEFANLLFVTKRRNGWVLVQQNGRRTVSVGLEFGKVRRRCGFSRRGTGFYSFRHTFQTIGDEAGDPLATSHIMGHVDSSTAGHYRERISDERLQRVTDHVRAWLYADTGHERPDVLPMHQPYAG